MDPKAIALIGIRGAALALALSGQTHASNTLYAAADAFESGLNIDAHMKEIAEKLKTRATTDDDWKDVRARIEADSGRLQNS